MEKITGEFHRELEAAAASIRRANAVVVLTGAGVSAESGLPTFRSGQDGMWQTEDVRNFAYPDGYRRNAARAWEWYAHRAAAAARAMPNAAHHALADLERRVREFLLITQNIDGLHQRAGSRTVLELHGNLLRTRCFGCETLGTWPEPLTAPVCESCGGLRRPDVVFFQEDLPVRAMARAQAAALDCDVLISVGTSNVVWPAAEIPQYALSGGAEVLIVNTEMRGQPEGNHVSRLHGPAGEVLPRLLELAWPQG